MIDGVTGYPDHLHVGDDTSLCFNGECLTGTAREALENTAYPGGPEYVTWFLGVLETYRAEVLRESAAEIRAEADRIAESNGHCWEIGETVDALCHAAELVDPDKEQS
jgi:hypothetical protein